MGHNSMSLSILRIKCLNKVFYVALFSLVLLLINILIPIQFKPNETNALTGTVNPSILTFSSISSVSRVAILNNDSSNGSFVTSNANDAVRFSIATNNYTGYTLRIKSSSGDTTLSNGEYSINSINGITTLTDFRNPSNTNYNNKWGLLPSKYANGDIIVTNTNAYLPIPNTTGTILNITTSANSNDGVSNPDEYSIGIGVRVDYNTVAGDYETNALVLEYVANPITYSITYDANDGNDGADTTNMPTINPETGSVDATTSTITLSSKIPEREGFVFQGWCTVQVADDASCTGTEYQPGDTYGIDFTVLNTTILYARWAMANYSITIKTSTGISNVSLNGTSCTNSTTGCEITGLVYNQSYTLTGTLSEGYSFSAWSKSGSGSIADATALTTSFTVGMGTATITASATPNLYTCTKQYRLQNADGTFPDNYTADGTEQVYFGDTCSYSKTVTDYKGSESGTNDAEASTSGTMVVGGLTLSLDLYRNTYGLTVSRNTTYISSASVTTTAVHTVSSTPYYRWGQDVSISATAASNSRFTSWSQTVGTTSSFASTTTASTTFTMPKSVATIYANGETTKVYMQNFTKSMCQSQASSGNVTIYDSRDQEPYTVRYINGNCWMTKNLYLGIKGSTMDLTSSNTNITGSYTLPSASGAKSTSNYGVELVLKKDNYAFYTFAAATAGTNPRSGNATQDICPKNWRLPTYSEYNSLVSIYSNATAITGAPFNAQVTGRVGSGSWTSVGSVTSGGLWSSTGYDQAYAYYLGYNTYPSLNTSVTGREYRYDGYGIRCVAKS